MPASRYKMVWNPCKMTYFSCNQNSVYSSKRCACVSNKKILQRWVYSVDSTHKCTSLTASYSMWCFSCLKSITLATEVFFQLETLWWCWKPPRVAVEVCSNATCDLWQTLWLSRHRCVCWFAGKTRGENGLENRKRTLQICKTSLQHLHHTSVTRTR